MIKTDILYIIRSINYTPNDQYKYIFNWQLAKIDEYDNSHFNKATVTSWLVSRSTKY